MSNKQRSSTTTRGVTKSRQKSACDRCRARKKRCDGQFPCDRCQQANLGCSFTDAANRVRNIPDVLSKIQASQFTVETRKKLLQAYFDCSNPIVLFNSDHFSVDNFLQPNSKQLTLQLMAILATSSRCMGETHTVILALEKQSRDLAAELMDDFTFTTAMGFHLLSYHFWGQDEILSSHYKEITLSLCRHGRMMPKNSSDFDKLRELQIATLGIQNVNYKNITEELSRIIPNGKHTQGTAQITHWALLRAQAVKYLLVHDNVGTTAAFSPINQQAIAELNYLIREVYKNLVNSSRISKELADAIHELYGGLLEYVSGNRGKGILQLERASQLFSSNTNMVAISDPFYIYMFHSAFHIAYLEQNLDLATSINQIQSILAGVLPSAQIILQRDNVLLARMVENSTHQPIPTSQFLQYPQNVQSSWTPESNMYYGTPQTSNNSRLPDHSAQYYSQSHQPQNYNQNSRSLIPSVVDQTNIPSNSHTNGQSIGFYNELYPNEYQNTTPVNGTSTQGVPNNQTYSTISKN